MIDELEEVVGERGNIVEYHSCDFFPERWFDAVVVLRTDNTILYDRLQKRYSMICVCLCLANVLSVSHTYIHACTHTHTRTCTHTHSHTHSHTHMQGVLRSEVVGQCAV